MQNDKKRLNFYNDFLDAMLRKASSITSCEVIIQRLSSMIFKPLNLLLKLVYRSVLYIVLAF